MLHLLLACSENELNSTKPEPTGGDTAAALPDIVVSPGAVDFGEVQWGDVATAVVTISNEGDATHSLEGVRLAGDSPEVTWTALDSPILPPGTMVDTVLTWAPTAGIPLDEVFVVASDDPDEREVEVPLSGTIPYGEIYVEPTTYDYGVIDVGTSATTSVTVSNIGAGPLTIDGWTYAGSDDMTVVDPGALLVLPAVLAPGESTEMWMSYAPSSAGGDEAALDIQSDDPIRPSTGAQHYGEGQELDPCDGYTQTVELLLTADDSWQAWMDNTEFTGPNANTWSASDSFTWEMECGDHSLAIYATDVAHAVSGVIAVVWVEGSVRFVSGPTDWTMVDSVPPAGWTDPAFDDSSWHIPEVCASSSIWGSSPQPFYDAGAQWIWWSSNCANLGEAWFRLNFTVP